MTTGRARWPAGGGIGGPAGGDEFPGRDHSLTVDSGRQDVAEAALDFLKRNRLPA